MVLSRYLAMLALLSLAACNAVTFVGGSKIVTPTPAPYYDFPKIFGINEHTGIDFVKTSTDQLTVAVATDASDGSVITFGSLNGETVDGQLTTQSDLYLFKSDHTGKVVWSIVFNSAHPMIQDASGVDSGSGLYLDQANKMIYLIGVTTGALVETNATGNTDIVVAKVSTNGSVIWIRQYGYETQESLKTLFIRPSLDFSQNDRAGQIRMTLGKKLLMTFETTGSVFDTNNGVATTDMGAILINPVTGNIEKGMQIGATAAAVWGGNSSKGENVSSASFDFDGTKAVIPFRTGGSIKDTNVNISADAGYFVLDENLNLQNIVHVGSTTYAAWVGAGNYAGVTSGDDQFRSVVVIAPSEYLFYGKSSSRIGEASAGNTDYIFMKFANNVLEKIVQYGSTTLPGATSSEEPRHMIRTASGKIFCSGHSRSNIFSLNAMALNSPIIFEIDEEGGLVTGYQLGDTERTELGIPLDKHILVLTQGFDVPQDKQIRTSFNVSSVSTSGPFTSYLWSIDL